MDPWLIVLGIITLLAIGILSYQAKLRMLTTKRKQRRAMLFSKYRDDQVVSDILEGLIRQGMTAEMVMDSWGRPAAVDRKVYRTKTKEVLKYGPRRSFASRVTIEDGIVVGWEQR